MLNNSNKNTRDLLLYTTILFFLFSIKGFSQKKFTLADVSYLGSFNAKYAEPDTNLSSDFGYLEADLSFPIVLNDKTAIITGIMGNSWKTNYGSSASLEEAWPTTLHSLGLKLGFNHKISDKNSFLFVTIPKLNSDFKTVDINAFQMAIFTTYSFRKNENFLWKLGMYYSSEFYGPSLIPLFGLDWNVTDKITIKGDLPIHGKVNYKINEDFNTGIGYVGLTSTYRMTEFDNAYATRSSIEPYLFTDFKVIKNIYLNIKAGYTLKRDYSIYNATDKMDLQVAVFSFGDDRGTQLNPDVNNGAFVKLGLAYKIDIE